MACRILTSCWSSAIKAITGSYSSQLCALRTALPNPLPLELCTATIKKYSSISTLPNHFLSQSSAPIIFGGCRARFSTLNLISDLRFRPCQNTSILNLDIHLLNKPFFQPQRGHIKFSMRKCKRKTVKAVVGRFYRLQWGAWIRTKAGRQKKLWRKSWKRRKRLRRHVFVNATQKRLLDHMVTRFWKRPRYYVDDPYQPYHVRHGIPGRSSQYPSTFR